MDRRIRLVPTRPKSLDRLSAGCPCALRERQTHIRGSSDPRNFLADSGYDGPTIEGRPAPRRRPVSERYPLFARGLDRADSVRMPD
ncbi:hypothetical protein [Methanoculleus sp.]|uniref:hypothetical protein n=1 Tax=Methanoculleus sp. TaxID=90427 RepID=UPI00262593F2|nr:hypothetical protein [Methanoculleus sp.]